MADRNGTPLPPDRRVTDDSSEFVQTGVAAGTVRLRRGTAEAFSWTRLGVVLAIAGLLGAAVYIAGTPLDAGNASASDDPGPSASEVADASVAPTLVEILASPEPSVSSTPEPSQTQVTEPTEAPEATETIDEGPVWTPRIWSFDPDARFEASVELTESCLLSQDGWDAPHAQVMFQVAWDGEIPLALIKDSTDGVGEGGYGGDIEVSGSFGLGIIATTGEPHVLSMWFYADTEAVGPGPEVKQIDTRFEVDPTEPCYGDAGA